MPSKQSKPKASEIDNPHINRFIEQLWFEHSLAENTLNSYRNDLNQLASFLLQKEVPLEQAEALDLQGFIAYRYEQGQKPASAARQLSTLKRFYRFLIQEKAEKMIPARC